MAGLKTGESQVIEHGTKVTMGETRLVITSEIQRTASKRDIAAHLRAVAARIESLTT